MFSVLISGGELKSASAFAINAAAMLPASHQHPPMRKPLISITTKRHSPVRCAVLPSFAAKVSKIAYVGAAIVVDGGTTTEVYTKPNHSRVSGSPSSSSAPARRKFAVSSALSVLAVRGAKRPTVAVGCQ